MNVRARYHAIRAYVRASARYQEYRDAIGWDKPEGMIGRALDCNVARAWHRLPDTVKSAVQPPEAR